MGVSRRQVQKYIKRLTNMNLIVREGGRKIGTWRITDAIMTVSFLLNNDTLKVSYPEISRY